MCYKILNGEVSLKCNLFGSLALTYTREHTRVAYLNCIA